MGSDGNNNINETNVPEESSPLLAGNGHENGADKGSKVGKGDGLPLFQGVKVADECGWTADGLPLIHGSVVGEPVERNQWNSGLCACLGRNNDFCSSDLEVCLIGSMAPCVLYGTNAERLGSTAGTFSNHCLPYSGLYLIGNFLFGWNCLAPWLSYSTRSAIRRKFNLEGTCEALNRSCGCCGGCIEDEMQREHCETTCDFMTHVLCHTCALCQEGRELRRRLPHPGFKGQQPVLVMIPPTDQNMDC